MALEWTRKPEYELHPVGEWKAQFVEWAEDKHEKFGIQVKLSFDTEVVDDEGQHRRMNVWTKPSLHPKGRVYQLLTAFGINPDEITDEQLANFDDFLDDLIGKRLRLSIAHEPKKDDPKTLRDCIKSFLPYRKVAVKTGGFDDEPETSGDRAAQVEPKPEPVKKTAQREKATAAASAKSAPEPDWNDDED